MEPRYFYIGSDGKRHYMDMGTDNASKNMQDKTESEIRCSSCLEVIVSASRVNSYRQRDIDQMMKDHRCRNGGKNGKKD